MPPSDSYIRRRANIPRFFSIAKDALGASFPLRGAFQLILVKPEGENHTGLEGKVVCKAIPHNHPPPQEHKAKKSKKTYVIMSVSGRMPTETC